jgi:hypothetical protein
MTNKNLLSSLGFKKEYIEAHREYLGTRHDDLAGMEGNWEQIELHKILIYSST